MTIRTVECISSDYRLIFIDGYYELAKGRELTGIVFFADNDTQAIEWIRKQERKQKEGHNGRR